MSYKTQQDSLIEHCGGVVVGGHSLVGGLAIENGALDRLVRLNGVVVGLRVERFKKSVDSCGQAIKNPS